jgi:hypothetical protein
VALRWSRLAYADLRRIHEFLVPVNPVAASRSVRSIIGRIDRRPLLRDRARVVVWQRSASGPSA